MELCRYWESGLVPGRRLMPQKKKYSASIRHPKVLKHISQASITRLTVTRYFSAMNSFYKWRRTNGLKNEPKFSELDLQLGNYLNYLYQNEMPLYLGVNCIAGFKKFFPNANAIWIRLVVGLIIGREVRAGCRQCPSTPLL